MKVTKDDKIIKYCIYVVLTAIVVYCSIAIINNFSKIIEVIYSTATTIFHLLDPLFIGLVIAYLLYPMVHFIESMIGKNKFLKDKIFNKKESRRIMGILLTYIFVIAMVSGIIVGIYVMIGGQISHNTTIANVISYISNYLMSSTISVDTIQKKLDSFNIQLPGNFDAKLVDILNYIQSYIVKSLGSLTTSIIAFASNLLSFFISIILSIYLIKDAEYFMELWNKFYYMIFRKSKAGKTIHNAFHVINATFSNYIKGQFLDAFFVGILSIIVLSLIGVDYAIIIGIISGICNMIPYVGPIIGTVLAALVGLLSGKPIMVLWAVLGMQLVQQIDNNLLAPKIVGDSVGLHPVFTMLAILIGGNVAGILGMLIAVPITASVKVLFSEWYNHNIDYESESPKKESESITDKK